MQLHTAHLQQNEAKKIHPILKRFGEMLKKDICGMKWWHEGSRGKQWIKKEEEFDEFESKISTVGAGMVLN